MEPNRNPFPGMNPFLERNWGPVHTALIGFIWEEIGRQLPPDLVARPEERVTIREVEAPAAYRADVAVSESWKTGEPLAWNDEADAGGGSAVATPQMIWLEEVPERWIEIRTAEGGLVTAIEVLSPSNKSGSGRDAYRAKQRAFIESLASLVEIDLLRGGSHVLAVPLSRIREKAPGTCYHICVSRASQPYAREVYSCPLGERLPAFRVPLRESDPDAVLDLQPLIDRCYESGRYHLSPHDRDPEPPFPPEEAAWVEERLKASGLR